MIHWVVRAKPLLLRSAVRCLQALSQDMTSHLHWMLGFENPPISQTLKLSPKEKKNERRIEDCWLWLPAKGGKVELQLLHGTVLGKGKETKALGQVSKP